MATVIREGRGRGAEQAQGSLQPVRGRVLTALFPAESDLADMGPRTCGHADGFAGFAAGLDAAYATAPGSLWTAGTTQRLAPTRRALSEAQTLGRTATPCFATEIPERNAALGVATRGASVPPADQITIL